MGAAQKHRSAVAKADACAVENLPSFEGASLDGKKVNRKTRRSLLSRFRKSDDGTAAVEFAMIALPFFMLLAFIAELGIGYLANKTLDLSVSNVSRQIRVGALTVGSTGTAEDGSALDAEAVFRKELCSKWVKAFFKCEDLLIDVQTVASWADRPATPDREEEELVDEDGNTINDENGDPETELGGINSDGFGFAPGGRLTINVVRVYYEWPTIIDFNNSNSRAWVDDKRLMSSSSAFLTEPF